MTDSKVKVIISGIDDFSQIFSRAGNAVGSLKDELRGLVELTGAAAAFEFVNKITEGIDAMGRLSQKTGVAVEEFSALAFAAKMDDVSVETMAKGLERLSKTLVGGDLSPKAQAAATAIQSLGIQTKDTSGKLRPLTDIMGDLADKFKNQIPATERAGYAMTIFGKSGAEMLPMLLEGRDGLKGFEDQAKSLGKVLSEEDVQHAREFQDSLKTTRAELEGLGIQFVEGLLPAINGVVKGFGSFNGQSSLAKDVAAFLGEKIKGLALTFTDVAYSIDLSILKGEQFLQWADRMNHKLNPVGASMSDKMFGKLPEFGDLNAGIQELDKNYGNLWAQIEHPPKSSLKEVAKDVGDVSMAAVDAQAELRKLFDALDALSNKTESLLEKEQDQSQRKIDAIDKQIEALHQLELVNAGTLLPDANAQINALLKERVQLILDQVAAQQKFLNNSEEMNKMLGAAIAVAPGQLPNAAPGADQLAQLDRWRTDTIASNQEAQKVWEQTRTVAERYAMELDRINVLHEKGAIDDQTYNRALEQIKGQYDLLTMAVRDLEQGLYQTASGGLAVFFTDISTGTKSAKAAFADFGKSILSEINRIIAKMLVAYAVQKLLGWAIGSAGGSAGGGLSDSTLSGGGGLDLTGGGADFNPPAFFAEGGHMSAGQVGIVGDGGEPEMWIPDSAGTVVPMSKMSSAGGGVTHIVYDFRNADPGSEARIMQAIKQMGTIARAGAVHDVVEMRLRGRM